MTELQEHEHFKKARALLKELKRGAVKPIDLLSVSNDILKKLYKIMKKGDLWGVY